MQGINKAINQKEFKSEYHKSIVSIIYVFNLIKNNHNKILKQHKITEQQYNILRILRGTNPMPCNIGILKERMLDKMSDASRLVNRLVNLKLAIRKENEKDRRVAEVYISYKGLKVLAEIDSFNDDFESVIKHLSIEESKILNSILDKIIDSNQYK
jgi:DNA-binding MarR family transcriptional regulator